MEMGRATKLIVELERMGDPLSSSITREMMPKLVENLRNRLGISDEVLNLSPSSLKRLDALLRRYHSSFAEHDLSLSDESLAMLIREIAAYLGEVLLVHTQAKLADHGTLWGTHLVVEGRLTLKKEGKKQEIHEINMSLGNLASIAWDRLETNAGSNLFGVYRTLKSKNFQEKF